MEYVLVSVVYPYNARATYQTEMVWHSDDTI